MSSGDVSTPESHSLSDPERMVLELIDRRHTRKEWIRIKMTGALEDGRAVSRDHVSRWLRQLGDKGLVSSAADKGPQLGGLGPIWRLTPAGRDALAAG